ncbi:uncharacterized protein LOC141895295 isoform X3 [Acropora palmata]|uniref:uncharacterized protein LOC141895295 isoform X3 n=1 Tax=Acropora palmata TaxID=6131 RepID=UPI003DA100D5
MPRLCYNLLESIISWTATSNVYIQQPELVKKKLNSYSTIGGADENTIRCDDEHRWTRVREIRWKIDSQDVFLSTC